MQVSSLTTSGIGNIPEISRGLSSTNAPENGGPVSFEKLMTRMLKEADSAQQVVAQDVDQLMTGEVTNIHDVAINVAKADIAFRLVLEVRNKLIAAYQEVMRMQV
jgi:flagellar hook-basal body complex protein FliE